MLPISEHFYKAVLPEPHPKRTTAKYSYKGFIGTSKDKAVDEYWYDGNRTALATKFE